MSPDTTEASGSPLAMSSLAEFADEIGMSERWLRECVREGMPHGRLGRVRIVIFPAEAREWLYERFGRGDLPPPADDRAPEPLRLLRVADVADQLGMSERWVREQTRVGMPHLKLGHAVRFDPAQTRAWLDARYRQPR